MLEELESLKIEDKEKYLQMFKKLIASNCSLEYIKNNPEIICKKIKGKEVFHIVPNKALEVFNKLSNKYPDEFLGITVKIEDKRVSCFGIPCNEVTKVIIN